MKQITPEQLAFCARAGLERGFDVDTKEPQEQHVCWPYILSDNDPLRGVLSTRGALCKTEYLWGHAGAIKPEIETEWDQYHQSYCEVCLAEVTDLMTAERKFEVVKDLIESHDRCAREIKSLSPLHHAIEDLFWCFTNPEKANSKSMGLINGKRAVVDAWYRVREAYNEYTKRFSR